MSSPTIAHPTGTLRRRLARSVVPLLVLCVLASGCSTIFGSSTATIVFATQSLGSEGKATTAAIAAFEKASPSIKVEETNYSPSSDTALRQLEQRFIAGSQTPDVISVDVTQPVLLAAGEWIRPLGNFHPDLAGDFPGQVASTEFQGKSYGVPWFINAEGVYYRSDLVTPPRTPDELVGAAEEALAHDPSLKDGFAFEGAHYEGAVTAFINFLGGFGGKLDPNNLDTPENLAALTYMHDLIYSDHIAPPAVTGWQESNVEAAYVAGKAVFAMNWPYVFQLAEARHSPVAGKTGWIPFPSPYGMPAAALGGADLVINANTTHAADAWKLVQYLSSEPAQLARAVAAGDPPALRSAYTPALFALAPYFRQERKVFAAATPRPVLPGYPDISGPEHRRR